MIDKDNPYKELNSPDVNFINLSQTYKPVVDYAGMIVVGANIEEFPELSELPNDADD